MKELDKHDDETSEDKVYIFDNIPRLLALRLANPKCLSRGLPLISEVTVIGMPSKTNGKEQISTADLTVAMIKARMRNPHTAYALALVCPQPPDEQIRIARSAPAMYDAMANVKQEPAFPKLNAATRVTLSYLTEKLKNAWMMLRQTIRSRPSSRYGQRLW